MLKHLSSALDAALLFATHYFGLTAEFAGDARVANGHMAALVGGDGGSPGEGASLGSPSRSSRRDADKLQSLGLGFPRGAAPWASPRRSIGEGAACGAAYDEAQITFLYRLRPGACPRSYGLQVRRAHAGDRRALRGCLLRMRVLLAESHGAHHFPVCCGTAHGALCAARYQECLQAGSVSRSVGHRE